MYPMLKLYFLHTICHNANNMFQSILIILRVTEQK